MLLFDNDHSINTRQSYMGDEMLGYHDEERKSYRVRECLTMNPTSSKGGNVIAARHLLQRNCDVFIGACGIARVCV